jgi:hypothetical protein
MKEMNMKRNAMSLWPLLMLLLSVAWAEHAFAYYDPGVQRWINRDPIEEDGGINLYVFVRNNPSAAIDRFGFTPSARTIGLIADLAGCYAIMQRAYNSAQNAQGSIDENYTCVCANGKEITPNQAMPGNGLGHCLVGYYAKRYGASKACLAEANLGFEIAELRLLEWLKPIDWAVDTGRDVAHTFRGYGKNSPEECLPSNCKKKG